MSRSTCSNSKPRVSTLSAASAQNMNASSGSGLCPSRMSTRARLTGSLQEKPRSVSRGHPKRRLDLRTVAGPALTEAIQDYLKAIYKLQEGDARVSVTALAREQRVAAGSASEMVKKLAALEHVDHTPYKGIRLTPAGERAAVELTRVRRRRASRSRIRARPRARSPRR